MLRPGRPLLSEFVAATRPPCPGHGPAPAGVDGPRSPPPLLAYGRTRRVDYRRIARRAGLALGTLAVVAGVARYTVPKVYYRERDRLAARLEQVPGTRVTSVEEYPPTSGWTFTPAWVTVQVGGRPGAVLTFGCGPTADSLWDAGGVVLYQIGPRTFEIEQYISPAAQVSWNYLDLSPGSEFAPLVGGFEARAPEDVIRDYDLLVAAVGRLPRAGTFTGRSGTVYRYRIE